MFDYYKHYSYKKGQDIDFENLIENILESNKKFYIFASHGHGDHFNKRIFEYNSPRTTYIFSDDIINNKALNNSMNLPNELMDNIRFMSSGQYLNIGNLKISTFSSTDLGLSFIIETDVATIFYAGDLNWWAWSDDTEEEAKYMENLFKGIIDEVINADKSIEIAFFPVDQRLEQNYDMGANYFIKHLKPKYLVPMHFGNEFNTTKVFSDKYKNIYTETKMLTIDSVNSIINLL
jgi:L-ascorbate metabolism protein UlaG (beta-lactamase superfamily)